MKTSHESPGDRGAVAGEEGSGGGPAVFTPESIQRVKDFTARKTLEQAHAFVTGLGRLLAEPDPDDSDRALLRDLASLGIGARDAEQVAGQAISLMELMADRDRKAEIFHAAVKEAGQSERAMYERLALFARVLRGRLGRSAGLAKVGVAPEAERAGPRPGKAIYSAATGK